MPVNGHHIGDGEIVLPDEREIERMVHSTAEHRKNPWVSRIGFLLGIITLAFGVVWATDDRSPILSYGGPDDVYFCPRLAKVGGSTNICFDNVEWMRICRSDLVYNITCRQEDPKRPGQTTVRRIDFAPYPISTPQFIGKVDPKSRRFDVPKECLPGDLVYTAFARHDCPPYGSFMPKYTKMPTISMTVSDR